MKKLFLLLFFLSTAGLFAQQKFPEPAHLNDDVRQKMGFKDPQTGQWVIKPIFDFVKPFGEDGTAVVFTQQQVGFIDLNGKLLFLTREFDDAENFNKDGIAVARKKGDNSNLDAHMQIKDKFGLINKKGQVVVPFRFDNLNSNSFPGTFVAQYRGMWGIIDAQGRTKLDFAYYMINIHKSLKAGIVRIKDQVGVVGPDFEFVVPMGDNMARFAGEGLISLYNGSHYGYINFRGDTIIPFDYDQFSVFKDGITLNRKNGFYGMIDTTGKTLIPFEYSGGEPLHNDTAVMLKQDKFGMINGKNEILLEFIYDKISRFYYPRPPGGYVLIRDGIYYYLDPQTGKPELWKPVFPPMEKRKPVPVEEEKKEEEK